jgi:hypothetical protein
VNNKLARIKTPSSMKQDTTHIVAAAISMNTNITTTLNTMMMNTMTTTNTMATSNISNNEQRNQNQDTVSPITIQYFSKIENGRKYGIDETVMVQSDVESSDNETNEEDAGLDL